MYDIIIVGAGTAGLSAAIYGLRAGKTVLLLEALAYGGQIINTPEVENYPGIKHISGFEFAHGLYEQAVALGAELKYEEVLHLEDAGEEKLVKTAQNTYTGRTVILATGARPRTLGVDREAELVGAGISYCATCDGAFFKGKVVGVVGGGNTALEDALFLSNYCERVYVIHRREGFRGEKPLLDKLQKKENIEFVLHGVVTSLLADERLKGVEITDTRTEEKRHLALEGLFIAIGQLPANQAFAKFVDLDTTGYIAAGENCRTKTPGIFTAGDCRTKGVRQLATAAADGAVAGLAASEYIG